MEAATPPVPTVSDYPVRLDVQYPERLSRWKIFVKWLLLVPHYIVLYLLGIVGAILVFLSFFAILFTRRYPRGMFNFVVWVQRWGANVNAYLLLLRDDYPPFTGGRGKYPVTLEVEYPEQLSRWKIFVKWLLVIPNLIAFLFVAFAALLVIIAAWFVILFTGRLPRGMFDFVVGTLRWALRANAYAQLLLTDRYPPFSLK